MHATNRGVIVALWIATVAAAFGIGWIASPPHASPVPDDLAASLRSALGEGDVIERQERTASLLKGLDADAVPEVVALYERMIPLIDASELGAFFAAWARFDPLGALDHARGWRRQEVWTQREIGVRAVIRAWAQREPLAAREAVAQIGINTPSLREPLRQSLVAGWAHSPRGHEGLAAFIAELPPLHARFEILETVAEELVRGGGAEAVLLGWAEPILRDEGHKPVMKRAVFRTAAGAAAQLDPERTAAWTVQHSQADYAQDGVGIVAEHWGRLDGAAAMAWLGEQPPGEGLDEAIRDAFGQWTRVDPRGALKWLGSEESSALRDPARELKAQRLGEHEPERALEWCERIEDEDRRLSCLESVAMGWYAKDAVAAETWLQESSLDEEARRRVREVAAPKRRQPGEARRQRQRPGA
jgi:hypothetical protein